MTADEARGRVGEIRAELRRAMRLLSKPCVDWDAAAGRLYRVECDCRRLATDCVIQEVREDSNGY